jgi:hypothetical protein
VFILISFNSIANTTVSTSSALRAAIQAAISSHSIMVQGITPALEANGYSVLTFAKRSSFVPAATPFSGYTAQGTSTTLSSSALLVDSLIFLQDVDGANAAGTAKNFLITQMAPRRATRTHRLVRIYQSDHVAQCHPVPERSFPA